MRHDAGSCRHGAEPRACGGRLVVAALTCLLAALATAPAGAQEMRPDKSIVMVLDASNSMWGQIEGRSKIEIARDGVAELLAGWPAQAEIGLVAYGHRREGDCRDIEMVVPVGPLDAAQFTSTIAGLTPTGKTPLTAAVRQAAEMLRYQDRPATVILFSDGIETCNADPCMLAEELERGGVAFTAHVIGFDTAADQRQLACLAEATGGLYLTADSSKELGEALRSVRSVATDPDKADLVTLEGVDELTGEVLRDGVVWTVVALESETRIPITAGTARPALPLAPGTYFAEARRGGARGRLQFNVVEGEAATHQVSLAARPVGAASPQPGQAAGLAAEEEPNSSFGRANPVGATEDPAQRLTGESFGTAKPVGLPADLSARPAGGGTDWYRFSVADQGALELSLEHSPAGADLAARLWDAEKSTVSGWLGLDRGDQTMDLPRSGEYVLEVRNNGREPLLEEAYRLGVAFAPTGDVHEPNDEFGRAAPIRPSGIVKGAILPRGDVDWFALDVPDQGELAMRLPDAPREVDPVARVWNVDKSTISGWLTLGERPVITDLPAKGRYLVEVRDGRDDARSAAFYSVETVFTATGDSHEPNNSFGTAAAVGLDGPITGAILPRGDADWYALSVEDQGELTLQLASAPEEIELVGRVWDEEESTLTGWLEFGERPVAVDLPRNGRYILEVHDARDDARSPASYQLQAQFTATGDAYEPNDGFGAAALVELGGPLSGAILPKGDSDWFAFDVRKHGELRLEAMTAPEPIDLVVRIWDGDKSTISGWLEFGRAPIHFDLPRPGRYVLEVRDGRNDARSPEPYRLATRFTASGEPLDGESFGTAATVPGKGTIEGTILPKGDSDWFRIVADAPGGLTIDPVYVAPELGLVVRVWDAEKSTVTGWLRASVDARQEPVEVALPAGGPYLLEVRDDSDDSRSVEVYRLLVSWPGMEFVNGDIAVNPQSEEAADAGGGVLPEAGAAEATGPQPAEGAATADGPGQAGARAEEQRAAETREPAATALGADAGQADAGARQQPTAGEGAPTGSGASAALMPRGEEAGGSEAVRPGTSQPDGEGRWTAWIDRDSPGGSGDWEPLQAFVDVGLVCNEPLEIECQTSDGKPWESSGQVYTCEPQRGGICRNDAQTDGSECLNYRVRFLCPSDFVASE